MDNLDYEKMEFPIKVNVLGTEYTIEKHRYQDDAELKGLGGYCRFLVPQIVIGDLATHPDLGGNENIEVLKEMEKETIRHELLHAFLNESGIADSSFASDCIPWAKNEEMIDWFAIQSPKIMKAYKEIGCI